MKKKMIAYLIINIVLLSWLVFVFGDFLRTYKFYANSSLISKFSLLVYYYQIFFSIVSVLWFITLIFYIKASYRFKMVVSIVSLLIVICMLLAIQPEFEMWRYFHTFPSFFSLQVFLDFDNYILLWRSLDAPLYSNFTIIEKLYYVSKRSVTMLYNGTSIYPSIYLELSFIFYFLQMLKYYLLQKTTPQNPPFTKEQLEYINSNYRPKDSN